MTTITNGPEGSGATDAETRATVATTSWMTNDFVRAFGRGAARLHRGLYRLSGGKIGGSVKGVPLLLLTTRGRKSGRAYTWPVGYVVDGEDLLLIASAGGGPRNPGWYYNLCTNPNVTIEIGRKSRAMVAEPQTGTERAKCWARTVAEHPLFDDYQRKVTREIPVVLLRPAQ